MPSAPWVVEPLTAERWPAFETLLSESGPGARCWCMYWRIGSDYRGRPADENRSDLRRLVEDGTAPGLLAMEGDDAVGWCQVTPRADVPALDRPWRLKPVDDLPVWSISCFYVRRSHRRSGVTEALIDAAVGVARKAGAPAVEAYPLDGQLSPSATSTGYASTFEKAGFTEVERRSPERPIMRLWLDSTEP